ncbi:transaldolase family protein [Nitrosomonas marina]|uniref:Fructose 6-phosphate aldolase n=1 Tax=Nitrosomonas marina TaxID=917 RepID=A0A1H8ENE1_9PROT|nr:transaldolase family protein [Nitrosomonas marina]SEN20983.1 fructose 6-phosphate aldolase [Nitrosomonas marina]
MFELYLDTADIDQIACHSKYLPLRGITTNPSILANTNTGLQELLPKVREVIGEKARIHVQVVSANADAMLNEAVNLHKLPYDIVVKVPATETGIAAIRMMKRQQVPVLATAIYSVQQGFLAALCGADYLAPYVSRIDSIVTSGDDNIDGIGGVGVVADLQALIDQHQLPVRLLPASFKNMRQVLGVLNAGVSAITIPPEIAVKMLSHPALQPAVDRFNLDWQTVFGQTLPFES